MGKMSGLWCVSCVIELPENVTHIESQAFVNTAAEMIVIPAGCISVAPDAFDRCSKLETILNFSAVPLGMIPGVTIVQQ